MLLIKVIHNFYIKKLTTNNDIGLHNSNIIIYNIHSPSILGISGLQWDSAICSGVAVGIPMLAQGVIGLLDYSDGR